jgi:hypothetical protein
VKHQLPGSIVAQSPQSLGQLLGRHFRGGSHCLTVVPET